MKAKDHLLRIKEEYQRKKQYHIDGGMKADMREDYPSYHTHRTMEAYCRGVVAGVNAALTALEAEELQYNKPIR